jgi:hypothetical protein
VANDPELAGACCRRLVSANEQLDLGGRFGAFVSGLEFPFPGGGAQCRQRPGSNPELLRGKSEDLMLPRPFGWHVAETGDSHSAR